MDKKYIRLDKFIKKHYIPEDNQYLYYLYNIIMKVFVEMESHHDHVKYKDLTSIYVYINSSGVIDISIRNSIKGSVPKRSLIKAFKMDLIRLSNRHFHDFIRESLMKKKYTHDKLMEIWKLELDHLNYQEEDYNNHKTIY